MIQEATFCCYLKFISSIFCKILHVYRKEQLAFITAPKQDDDDDGERQNKNKF